MSARRRVVTQDLPGGWVVEMEWPEGQQHGGPGMLVIRPADPDSYPPGGLSSTVLREVNFRDATAQLQKQLAVGERRKKAGERYGTKQLDQLREELSKGISSEYLALLAALYVAKVNKGQPKPVESIADGLGKGLQTVRGHLWQARKQGLLTAAHGRKGGHLTDEARSILSRTLVGADDLQPLPALPEVDEQREIEGADRPAT